MLLSMEGDTEVERRILEATEGLLEACDRSAATWNSGQQRSRAGRRAVIGGWVPYTGTLLEGSNQMFAAKADKVYFMVAGLALEMKSLGALPYNSPELTLD